MWNLWCGILVWLWCSGWLRERGRIESGKFPFCTVTRAVGTEGRIVRAARVARIVTLLARRVKFVPVFEQPGGCFVRIGLRAFGQCDRRGGLIGLVWPRHDGQTVTEIAFEANRLLFVGGEMFAIVTAETAGPIFVTDVVRMGRPIYNLIRIVKCRIKFL